LIRDKSRYMSHNNNQKLLMILFGYRWLCLSHTARTISKTPRKECAILTIIRLSRIFWRENHLDVSTFNNRQQLAFCRRYIATNWRCIVSLLTSYRLFWVDQWATSRQPLCNPSAIARNNVCDSSAIAGDSRRYLGHSTANRVRCLYDRWARYCL
jgi:hypothetical protein